MEELRWLDAWRGAQRDKCSGDRSRSLQLNQHRPLLRIVGSLPLIWFAARVQSAWNRQFRQARCLAETPRPLLPRGRLEGLPRLRPHLRWTEPLTSKAAARSSACSEYAVARLAPFHNAS